MLEKVTVTLIDVDQCGFYAFGQDKLQFGGLSDTVAELSDWSDGKEVGHTGLLTADVGVETLPVYLFGLREAKGTALITLWNQVPEGKSGGVMSVPQNARVGQAQQVDNPIAKKTIPGFPTYYYFLPDENVIASLRFNERLMQVKPLQAYVERFLAIASSHAVRVKKKQGASDLEDEIWAYRNSAKQAPNPKLYPRFRLSISRREAQLDELRLNVHRIQRVHRRMDLDLKDNSERKTWQKFADWVGVTQNTAASKKSRINASVAATLTLEQLNLLIQEWVDAGSDSGDDYGFQLSKDPTVYWLTGSRASAEFKMNVERDAVGQIDDAKLLTQLAKKKDDMLALL